MSESTWNVHKFGGTSLANADRYRGVAHILDDEEADERSAVIVSAMSGVTNELIDMVGRASSRDASYPEVLAALRQREVDTVRDLLFGERAEALVERIEHDFDDIEDILKALWLLHTEPRAALDLICGYGELWSAQLLAAHLDETGLSATWLDARQVLVVGHGQLAPIVDWEASGERLAAWLATGDERIVVVTGFIASDPDGIPTTLGRNGSDYSASIFGNLLDASRIDIWTDVDGVMSANPRQVPDAVVLGELSYDEAMELAYFGAKVIHPSTMAPAVLKGIPVTIRNTFNPDAPGTRIHEKGEVERSVVKPAFTVKGIATIGGMALVNVEGTSMIGVPGIANRLFGALREAGVSVVLISQGSSEHSICFAVPNAQAEKARVAVEEAFFAERHHGQIQTIDVNLDCAIIAVVGDNMAGIPGVASSFFGALGKAGVNVRAIAQGSSERNISAVIDEVDTTRAVRAVHAGFYLSPQTISVGVLGTGVVGGALLEQLHTQVAQLNEEHGIDLRVRAIGTSETMWTDERSLDANWRDAESAPIDIDAFADFVQTEAVPHAVIVDATASNEIADKYVEWLERGIHVVTPNKRAGSGPLRRLSAMRSAGRSRGSHFLYETTVGAGLPIIHTLRDLIATGDRVKSIEGIFSGTLAYLFNAFDGTRAFSEIVREAKAQGYTEPDPRDDLSGTDVARKLVILAREIGLEIELDDVEVESLVPKQLESGTPEEFLERIDSVDDEMRRRFTEAKEAGEVLRYTGSIDAEGNARVSLNRFAETHPFGRIRLTDNIVEFRTTRYDENPLVVQGPGAGPDVTAGGVFADLLRLADYLGATR